MSTVNPYLYTITVQGFVDSTGELCFKATIKEFPDVAEFADTWQEAYNLAIDTIETASEAFILLKRPFPQPTTLELDAT